LIIKKLVSNRQPSEEEEEEEEEDDDVNKEGEEDDDVDRRSDATVPTENLNRDTVDVDVDDDDGEGSRARGHKKRPILLSSSPMDLHRSAKPAADLVKRETSTLASSKDDYARARKVARPTANAAKKTIPEVVNDSKAGRFSSGKIMAEVNHRAFTDLLLIVR
jgi:hypothetical protein